MLNPPAHRLACEYQLGKRWRRDYKKEARKRDWHGPEVLNQEMTRGLIDNRSYSEPAAVC